MSKGEGIILGLPVLGGKVQLSWDVLQKKGGGSKFISSVEGGSVME